LPKLTDSSAVDMMYASTFWKKMKKK